MPPETATRMRSPGCDHVEVVDRPPDLLTAVADEAVAAVPRVVAPHLDDRRRATAAALHAAPPGHDRPDLDDVVVAQALVVRRQRVVADHEHRLRHDLEVTQQDADVARRGDVELALRVPQDDPHGATFMERPTVPAPGPLTASVG